MWAAASWRCWAGVGGRPWAGLQARVKSPNRSTQLWRGLPFGRRRKELRPALLARLPRDLGSKVQGTEGPGDWWQRARVAATLARDRAAIGCDALLSRSSVESLVETLPPRPTTTADCRPSGRRIWAIWAISGTAKVPTTHSMPTTHCPSPPPTNPHTSQSLVRHATWMLKDPNCAIHASAAPR